MKHPIVFIHGSGDSERIWRLQIEHLGKERAFAIDLPGHGQRADTLPAEVTVLDYARAVHNILTSELQLAHPIIAGHSLGGAIALTMGLEYGAELSGLILIGTGARLRVHPDILDVAKNRPQDAKLQLTSLALTAEHAQQTPRVIEQEQEDSSASMLYRDLVACNIFDCMAQLGSLHPPALIICGTEDRLTPVKYSQYLHDKLPGSTLHLIPEAGHYVMREQPEAVNRAIEEWMK